MADRHNHFPHYAALPEPTVLSSLSSHGWLRCIDGGVHAGGDGGLDCDGSYMYAMELVCWDTTPPICCLLHGSVTGHDSSRVCRPHGAHAIYQLVIRESLQVLA